MFWFYHSKVSIKVMVSYPVLVISGFKLFPIDHSGPKFFFIMFAIVIGFFLWIGFFEFMAAFRAKSRFKPNFRQFEKDIDSHNPLVEKLAEYKRTIEPHAESGSEQADIDDQNSIDKGLPPLDFKPSGKPKDDSK